MHATLFYCLRNPFFIQLILFYLLLISTLLRICSIFSSLFSYFIFPPPRHSFSAPSRRRCIAEEPSALHATLILISDVSLGLRAEVLTTIAGAVIVSALVQILSLSIAIL